MTMTTGKDESRTRGLGRGLSALFDEGEAADSGEARSEGGSAQGVKMLPIETIYPNPDQPRKRFTDQELEELSESIADKGLLQPILVRPSSSRSGEFEIVAGERRWRAAQKARIHEIPCLVRELTDRETLEIAIVENVQRSDLTPVEEARAFRQLTETYGHTQSEVAEAVGKSRVHITNMLRLLALPDAILDMIERGELSAGHGRAIANVSDPISLAQEIIDKGLSVRGAEALARKTSTRTSGASSSTRSSDKDADTRALESNLSEQLGLSVELKHNGEKGELRIRYSTLEQLDELCRKLSAGH